MKTKQWMLGIGTLVFVVFFSALADTAQAQESWRSRMQQLGQTLSDLLPKVSSPKKFADPKNHDKIIQDISDLSKLAHGLAKPSDVMALPPDADPSIHLLMGTMDEDLAQAADAFQKGHVDYVRHLLQNISGYCVTCHTRTSQGINKRTADIRPSLGSISPYEKAGYLAATRQFDEAVRQYEKIMVSQGKSVDDKALRQKALQNALAITVRFKHDATASDALLNKVLARQDLTDFTRHTLLQWKETIMNWQAEPVVNVQSQSALRNKINELLVDGKNLQKNLSDEAALVVYLRVSALAHQLLSLQLTDLQTAEALYYAGMAHAAIKEGPVYLMPEMYFETCVKTAAHSGIARKCYREYEDEMVQSFTGSGGTVYPEGVQEQLHRLKNLAY